jgi:hypothetical protein
MTRRTTPEKRQATGNHRNQRWADEYGGMVQNFTVYEPEGARDTGLLDKDGNRIVVQRQPIGFDLSGKRRED